MGNRRRRRKRDRRRRREIEKLWKRDQARKCSYLVQAKQIKSTQPVKTNTGQNTNKPYKSTSTDPAVKNDKNSINIHFKYKKSNKK